MISNINNDDWMDLFFSADKNYLKFLYITINSIIDTSNKKDKFCFYVLQNDFSEKEKEILKKLIKTNGSRRTVNIEFIRINENDLSQCRKKGYHLTLSTFFRYLIPTLKPDIERALYLDIDIIVTRSLSTLWKIDIGDNYLAAVPNKHEKFTLSYKNKIGLCNNSTYYNAGVLLLNLKKMREDNISQKLIKNSAENVDLYDYGDQDSLNVTCQNRIKTLPFRYNMQGACIKNIQTDIDMYKEYKAMVIRHFTGNNKRMLENMKYLKGFYGNKKTLKLQLKSFKPIIKKKIKQLLLEFQCREFRRKLKKPYHQI